MTDSDLEQTLRDIDGIAGWLRPAQAERLWSLAAAAPADATIVEIGSFRAKSAIVLARAAGPEAAVYAIDPHAGNDRGPGEWEGDAAAGQADHEAFMANLAAAGVADRVVHVREFSQEAHDAVPGSIDVLYVDGAHGYAPARSDIEGWGARVVEGGTMAIHDVYNSVFVTLAVMRTLYPSGRWRYLGRERSLAVYRKERLSARQRLVNAARQAAGLPWFARNLVVKALRAVGLERVAVVVGHRPGTGIY